MLVRIGDDSPDFEIETTQGLIRLHDWMENSWCFLFSYPDDFSPVCTTEMGQTSLRIENFRRHNTKPIGLSTDTVAEHLSWFQDIERAHQTKIDFPVIADVDHVVSKLYGMIHPSKSDISTVRSVFVIDPNKKIRLTMNYPFEVGRNFDEILRSIQALQVSDRNGVATPADWQKGDPVAIHESIDRTLAEKFYPQGFEELTPYLRLMHLNYED